MPISSYFENQLKKLSLQKWLIESGNDSKEMTPEKIHQITILERKIGRMIQNLPQAMVDKYLGNKKKVACWATREGIVVDGKPFNADVTN